MTTQTLDHPNSSADKKPIRVLVIDDAEEDSALLELELRRGGLPATFLRVDRAESMRRALATAVFDIVLCDYVLPGFGVHAALDILGESGQSIPFIVISGIVRTGDVVEVLRSGADDFVEKDDLPRLIPAVERALRAAEERRARLATEEQLRQAQKMEAVGQLTGGIAHDFNNLLSAVKGYLELTEEEVSDSPELKAYCENALRAVRRCADLTLRLLAFSRRQAFTVEPVDANTLINEMVELLDRSLGSHIELAFKPGANLWITSVDPAQFESTILNLAINSRDAMPDGGSLTIETANETLAADDLGNAPNAKPGDYVVIKISDSGSGISPDIMERIFEPFFTTKEAGKGSGLGMSMVSGFAGQSGGHVSIESDPAGGGTTVRLHLPKADDQAAAAKARAADFRPVGGTETILVVEDDADVRGFVSTALMRFGYDVRPSKDGNDALAQIADGLKPDLLFVDLVLPGGVNGVTLAQEASKACPGLAVLFTTGYLDSDRLRELQADKSMRVVIKPYALRNLAEQVRDTIDESGR